MKRIVIGLAVIFLLILAVLFLSRPRELRPRYVLLETQPTGPFVRQQYNYGSLPIRDGKMWMWAMTVQSNAAKGRVIQLLYDLDRRKAVGQLFNAVPEFANRDQTRLLCEGDNSMHLPWKSRLGALAARILHSSAGPTNTVESFWVLDLRDNSSVWIGNLEQRPGFGSDWIPAPGFRFGWNSPSGSYEGREFYLCDLDKNSLEKVSFIGDLQGWWNDHELVATDADKNYVLFDVISRKTRPLFTRDAITQFLAGQGITDCPPTYNTTFNWNGSQYDFYVTADRRGGSGSNSIVVLRVEHEGPRFALAARNFQRPSHGHFDDSGTHYLYSSELIGPGRGGNGGVYLRDLSNNLDRVLVPPDNGGQFALARLYSNTVVYWHNRQLWRVDISTTNASPILP